LPPLSSNPSPPSSTLVAAPRSNPWMKYVAHTTSWACLVDLGYGCVEGRGGGHVVPARVVQPRPRRGVHAQLLVHRVLVPLRRVLMPLRRSCSGYATPASCSGEDATTEESFSLTRTPLAPQLHLPLENLFVRPLSPPYVKWVTIGSSCWRHLPSLQCPTKTHFLICLSLLEIA
jgi:hypothetical protein